MTTESTSARIALLRPPTMELKKNLSTHGAILPIGLAYIAAVLRDAGHQIQCIDAPGEALGRQSEMESPVGTIILIGLTLDEIVERVDPETEFVGITHMFLHEWPMICQIAEKLKAKIPNVKVIVGGENATAFWDFIFKQSNAVDYIVLGEGEVTFLDLINCLKAGAPIDHLHAVIQGDVMKSDELPDSFDFNPQSTVKPKFGPTLLPLGIKAASTGSEDGGVATIALPKRITSLDEIPLPAWEYFPVENYMKYADRHGVSRGRAMPILATRGCPYQCTFCSNPAMWTIRYTVRSPADVVREMKLFVELYRAQNFNFCDLTAIVKRQWIIEFCQLLQKEKLNITWQLPGGTRSEALDEEVLQWLYDTGCKNVTYAPESGSERMLDAIKKKVSLSNLLSSLKAAYRIGIVTRVNIIIGHPKEVRSDVWKSFVFLLKCALAGVQDAAVMLFAPYPGSEDTRDLIKAGKLTVDNDYCFIPLARSGWCSRTYNPQMSTRELVFMQFFMLASFYALAYLSHPQRIVQLVRTLFTGSEQTQLDALIRIKLRSGSTPNKPLAAQPH